MLALEEYEADIHHACGQPLSESTSRASQGMYDIGSIRCFACDAMEADAKQSADRTDNHAAVVRWPKRREQFFERLDAYDALVSVPARSPDDGAHEHVAEPEHDEQREHEHQ